MRVEHGPVAQRRLTGRDAARVRRARLGVAAAHDQRRTACRHGHRVLPRAQRRVREALPGAAGPVGGPGLALGAPARAERDREQDEQQRAHAGTTAARPVRHRCRRYGCPHHHLTGTPYRAAAPRPGVSTSPQRSAFTEGNAKASAPGPAPSPLPSSPGLKQRDRRDPPAAVLFSLRTLRPEGRAGRRGRRRRSRPATAASGRQIDAAVAIVSFSAVKDSMHDRAVVAGRPQRVAEAGPVDVVGARRAAIVRRRPARARCASPASAKAAGEVLLLDVHVVGVEQEPAALGRQVRRSPRAPARRC